MAMKDNRPTVPSRCIVVEDRGRKLFKDIPALAESIKRFGLMHPVVVEEIEAGKYKLIAGERRLRACLLAGITDIPISFAYELSSEALKEMELEENVQRSDLHWSEQLEILRQLDAIKRRTASGRPDATYGDRTSGFYVTDMAKLTGRSVGSVAMDLKLAKDLQENKDLAVQVSHLPKDMARKKMSVLLKEKALVAAMPGGLVSENITFKLGSCLDLIKELPDGSIDMVLTDPPFACDTMNQVGVSINTNYGFDETNMGSEQDMHVLYQALFPELNRVCKPGAHLYIFHAMAWYTRLHEILRTYGFDPDDQPLIWSKGLGTAKPKDWHYIPAYESITFAIKLPKGRPLMKPCPNVISIPPIHASTKIHPLQKPAELLSIFIENSSCIGETVLDPFAGSGSTLRAARKLHRNAIGFELSPVNFEIAKAFVERE